MNNFTRRAGARARLLAGVATVLAGLLTAPALAQTTVGTDVTLHLNPQAIQDLSMIRIFPGGTLSRAKSWPQALALGYTREDFAETGPVTFSSAQGFNYSNGYTALYGLYSELDIFFSKIDLATGLVYGDIYNLHLYAQPLFQARSVTGGGLISTTEPQVTVILHDLAATPALLDLMAANLGQFGREVKAQNLTTLQSAMGQLGDLQVRVGSNSLNVVTVVPEPANWLLMGMGLAALAGTAQARRRASALL